MMMTMMMRVIIRYDNENDSNRINEKILDRDWFSACNLSRNQRAITRVSKCRYLIRTFCKLILSTIATELPL